MSGGNERGGNSNVVKLYTALHLDPQQIAYCHPTLGTLGEPTEDSRLKNFEARYKVLAFGAGFKDDVLDAYRLRSVFCIVLAKILFQGEFS